MKRLDTIQKRENLNDVYRHEFIGPGGACHSYEVYPHGVSPIEGRGNLIMEIEFQKGPRKDPSSRPGVLDCDLLEIVRDRLKAFQAGPMASEYNAVALEHVEAALQAMNKRVEDRIERGVLGTMEK